jgi:hypothetical protein
MVDNTATAMPVAARSRIAARLSFNAAALSLVLLAALHVMSPEFDPSWRMVSEYALGDYSWVLALMFLFMAVGSGALFFAIMSHIRTIGGKIGLAFLLAAAVGLAMAAMFDWKHNLHGLASIIGVPSLPITAMLISVSLIRNQAWLPARRLLLWTANLTWMSLVLMLATLFIGLSQNGGQFGPNVLVGWPNRFLMLAYGGWLMVAAWHAGQTSTIRSNP